MRKIVDHLKSFSDQAVTVSTLDKIFGGQNRMRHNTIQQSFKTLQHILDLHQIEERIKSYSRHVEGEDESVDRAKAGFDASIGVETGKPSAKLSLAAGISSEDVEKHKEKIVLLYEGLSVIDYEAIRRELEKIITEAGAKAIIILIDEWSSVSLSIQPLLSEMIRKTLGVSDKIFLKFASLKFFTKLSAVVNAPQRMGFQVGVDVHPIQDLDRLLNYDADNNGVQTFLTWVAYRHACEELHALRRVTAGEFQKYLCSEVFDGEAVYAEIVRASEGNPRDFLALLAACTAEAHLNPGAKISKQHVIKTATRYFNDTKLPELVNSPSAHLLFQKLFQHVTKTKQKLFVASTDRAARSPSLQELWHYRFIHLVEPSIDVRADDGSLEEYAVYSIDYARLLALKIDRAGDELVEAMSKLESLLFPTGGLLTKILDKTGLRKGFGRLAVAQSGLEAGDINAMRRLAKECVVDHLL
jgi:hypothetical protein